MSFETFLLTKAWQAFIHRWLVVERKENQRVCLASSLREERKPAGFKKLQTT